MIQQYAVRANKYVNETVRDDWSKAPAHQDLSKNDLVGILMSEVRGGS